MYVPDSPSDLCRLLQLSPDAAQIEAMETLARQRGYADLPLRRKEDGDIDTSVLQAALMVVLWRVLRVPGSRATIVAPSKGSELACGELGHAAMDFLAEVCKTTDCVLSSISRLRGWHAIEFGDETGWEVRFCHNAPVVVAESALQSLTGLVIDAGDATSALGQAARGLEAITENPRGLVIRLW